MATKIRAGVERGLEGGAVRAGTETYRSSVSEVDCVRIFDAPPLIHPVRGIPWGSSGVKRVNWAKRSFCGG